MVLAENLNQMLTQKPICARDKDIAHLLSLRNFPSGACQCNPVVTQFIGLFWLDESSDQVFDSVRSLGLSPTYLFWSATTCCCDRLRKQVFALLLSYFLLICQFHLCPFKPLIFESFSLCYNPIGEFGIAFSIIEFNYIKSCISSFHEYSITIII